MNAKSILQQVFLILLFIAIVITLVIGLWPSKVVNQQPGVLARGAPKVTTISKEGLRKDGFVFDPVAHFSFKGRILERRNYYYILGMNMLSFDRAAAVSPVDFLIGWNEMSDEATLETFRFYIDGREWSWKPDDINDRPKYTKLVESNVAMVHVIPGNNAVDKKLDDIYVGHIVTMSGDIVKVSSTKTAYSWGTSKTEESVSSNEYIVMLDELRVEQ